MPGAKARYEDILEHDLMVILTKIARRIFSQTENTGGLSSQVDIIQDARAFYRAFRRCTGMTPTEYRNLYAQSEDNQ